MITFAKKLGFQYGEWVVAAVKNLDENGLLVRYEELAENPHKILKRICCHFNIAMSDDAVAEILRFSNSDTMRRATHFRQAKTGKWKDVFTKQVKDAFKESIGYALCESGYESDYCW